MEKQINKKTSKPCLTNYEDLFKRVSRKVDLKLAVFGQGYVGLPLSLSFARVGIKVLGIDKSIDLVNDLNKGICNDSLNLTKELQQCLNTKKYFASTNVKIDRSRL